jgi:hypothetical protein
LTNDRAKRFERGRAQCRVSQFSSRDQFEGNEVEPAPTKNSDGSHTGDCRCGGCYDPYGDAEWCHERIAELEAALDGVVVYCTDTLSGRVDGPMDAEWYKSGMREMRTRARAALKKPNT